MKHKSKNLSHVAEVGFAAVGSAVIATKRTKDAAMRVMTRIRKDAESIRERDPSAGSLAEILLLYPGLHATTLHRAAHALHKKNLRFSARAISQVGRFFTGIEIHPGAQLGDEVFIDHGSGVVIGETTVVGKGCTIYQGVTLGGTGKEEGKRHPTIGENVMVGAGARVLGDINIGDGAKIAAGAVVLRDVCPGATAVGVPAKMTKCRDSSCKLDQVNIPDPVAQELARMRDRIETLEELSKNKK